MNTPLPLKTIAVILLSSIVYTQTYADRSVVQPSTELLNRLGITEYRINEKIKVGIKPDDVKSIHGYSICETPRNVVVRVHTIVPNVNSIIVGAETESGEMPSHLFTVFNNSPPAGKYSRATSSVSLVKYQGRVMNIWAFLSTDKGIIANSGKAFCTTPDISE